MTAIWEAFLDLVAAVIERVGFALLAWYVELPPADEAWCEA